MVRIVVTVDGLAGSGKTTVARLLAARLKWVHFNSGLVYRAVAYISHTAGINYRNEEEVLARLNINEFSLKANPESGMRLFIGGRDVTELVRTPEISEITSIISAHPKVRKELVQLQREIFPGQNLVAEGRDMGSIIFSESPLKFFVEATEAVRTERRLKELYKNLDTMSQEERNLLNKKIEIEIKERDKRDTERMAAPTVMPKGAVLVDNSYDSLTFVVQKMYDAVLSRGLISAPPK